jgi:ribonucleoside-triphosphate reductase
MTRKIPTEVYSRVVGYFRPVDQWNNGKKAEWNDRRFYDANGAEEKREEV